MKTSNCISAICRTMRNWKRNHESPQTFTFLVFLLPSLILSVVCLLAGDALVVTPHDQLDGEVLVYMLNARHVGAATFPEMMHGIPAAGLKPAAPLALVFYAVFPPVMAYALVQAAVGLVGYLGMWLLLRELEVRPWISGAVSCAFSLLPFYPVYGLAVMGVPLLAWAALARPASDSSRGVVRGIVVAAVYAAASSPVLIGYAVVSLLFVYSAYLRGTHRPSGVPIAMACAAATIYGLLNFDLVLQLTGASDYISHKTEVVLQVQSFSLQDVLSLYLDGMINGERVWYHAESCQHWIAVFAPICVAAVLCVGRRAGRNEGAACILLIAIASVCLFYCAWRTPWAVRFRETLPGALRAFQADRVHWLLPTLYYVLAGVVLEALLSITHEGWVEFCSATLAILLVVLTINTSAGYSDQIATAKDLLGGEVNPTQMAWGQFFSPHVFEEVRDEVGPEACVVSLGLYPSIALYNGLNCLDGYSNNYPLEYKHEFTRIIEGELEMDEDLAVYFYGWGNRCYAFSHELGRRYLVPRDSGIVLRDVRLDFNAMQQMGGTHVISAVPIMNPSSCGLEEVGMLTGEGPYDVWVYRIAAGT